MKMPPMSSDRVQQDQFWRLGLDIGVGSIGWAVLDIQPRTDATTGEIVAWTPYKVRDLGVLIFPSGLDEDQQSANAKRRQFRSARRRLVSVKRRKQRLLRTLIKYGCIEPDEQKRKLSRDAMLLTPAGAKAIPAVWAWRWRAIREPGQLPKDRLGMVLMALAGSRGIAFSVENDGEMGQRLSQSTELVQRIKASGAKVFGDYAASQLAAAVNTTVRARNHVPNYLSREMVLQEFDLIRQMQQNLLTPDQWDEIRSIIFDMTPLKPPSPGRCPYYPEEFRIARADLDFQEYRILQTLRNIKIMPKKSSGQLDRAEQLSDEEVAQALKFLQTKDQVKPTDLFKAIGLAKYRSNFHKDEGRLPGNATSAALSKDATFGLHWLELPRDLQAEIVREMLDYRDQGKTPPYAVFARKWQLGSELNARNAFAALPRGRGAYGRTATRRLLDAMRQGQSLSEALQNCFPEPPPQVYHRLPYYGIILHQDVFDADPNAKDPEQRFGHVRNPAVHVVLNQLRGLVNTLCDRYGKPTEIVIELARDFRHSPEQRRKIEHKQLERRKEREQAGQRLRQSDISDTRANREKLLLWQELGGSDPMLRLCPYSLKPIPNIETLIADCEVDHIIPRSMCGDDSLQNKTVAFRFANKEKADRTPWAAFSGQNELYQRICERAKEIWGSTNPRKYRRFLPSAEEEFTSDEFVNRQLNDTAYAAKLARRYLAALGCQRIYATRGTISSRMRKAWRLAQDLTPYPPGLLGLSQKAHEGKEQEKTTLSRKLGRHNLWHHAIDAAVIALIDPTCLEKYFHLSEQQALDNFPLPWPMFKDELKELLSRTNRIVRHRPQHKAGYLYSGELLEAGRYRVVSTPNGVSLRRRSSLEEIALTPEGLLRSNAKPSDDGWLAHQWRDVADPSLQSKLRLFFTAQRYEQAYKHALDRGPTCEDVSERQRRARAHAEAWRALCHEFCVEHGGILSVPMYRKTKYVKLVDRKSGAVYAMIPQQNAFLDVFRTKDGSFESRTVTLLDAAKGIRRTDPSPGVPIVRLHKGDTLRLVREGQTFYVVVRGFKENGQIRLALHNNGNASEVAGKHSNIFQFYPDYNIEGDIATNVVFQKYKALVVRPSVLGEVVI